MNLQEIKKQQEEANNKLFGGGVLFQTYNLFNTEKIILELLNHK